MQKLEPMNMDSSDPLSDELLIDDSSDGEILATERSTRKPRFPLKFFGSTARVPMPEVLKEISLQELSGDLQVISGRSIRTLYFDRGFLVFAGSNLKVDRLGQCLLKSGKVTERELEMACRLMKGRRRIGEAMVEAGLLTEEELGREVARQAKRVVFCTYSLKKGIYSFDERTCVIPLDLRVGLSIYRIQLEGVRRMTSGYLILQGLGSIDRRLRCSEIPPFTVEENDLRPIERKVVSAAKKGGTVREIQSSVDEDKGKVLRAAYGLLCAGLLEYADMAPRELKVQEETEAFLLSSLDKRSDPSKAANVRQEVLLQFDALERATPGELLDVDESAGEEVIAEAYEKRRAEWEKKQKLIDNERSLYVKVEEIKQRLAAAHEAMLEKRQFPPLENAGLDYDDEEEFEFEFDDEVEDVSRAREDLDFDHTEEHIADSEGSPSESSTVAEEAFGRQGDETQPPVPESVEVSAVDFDMLEAIKEKRKRLLYDIKVRKAVNDAEGAISLIYELVELIPDNAKYEMMLADALASHPVLSKKAERHYRRALSLDPQNADLHYRIGLYYKSFNMKSRALAEFKTALRIDPAHSRARRGLVDLKGNNSSPMEQLFKKILG